MKKTKLETDLFYYGNYLELISKFNLSKQLTLNDLGNTPEDKAVIQKCYRDMKKEGFDGSVIDYLCSISAHYILDICDKETSTDEVIENNHTYELSSYSKLQLREYELRLNEQDKNSQRMKRATNLLILFIRVACKNRVHARNIVRLFYKRPSVIIYSNFSNKLVKEVKDYCRLILLIFRLVGVLYFVEFWREAILSHEDDKLPDLNSMEDMHPDDNDYAWEIIMPYALEAMFIESLDDHERVLKDNVNEALKKLKEIKKQNKPKKIK